MVLSSSDSLVAKAKRSFHILPLSLQARRKASVARERDPGKFTRPLKDLGQKAILEVPLFQFQIRQASTDLGVTQNTTFWFPPF